MNFLKTKKFLAVIAAALMLASMLTACGEKTEGADGTLTSSVITSETDVQSETTKVLEKTEDGGTVEQDAQGNIITKDENGEIVSVKDSENNEIDAEKYIAEHKLDNQASSKTSSAASSKTSSKTSTKSSSTASSNSSSTASSKSSSTTSADTSSSSSASSESKIPVDNVEVDFNDL